MKSYTPLSGKDLPGTDTIADHLYFTVFPNARRAAEFLLRRCEGREGEVGMSSNVGGRRLFWHVKLERTPEHMPKGLMFISPFSPPYNVYE